MPIRTRLTLSFTALFGVIVLGLAIGGFILFRNSLLAGLNTQLQAAVDGTAMAAEHELSEHDTSAPGEKDLQSILNGRRDAALPDTQILVRMGSREVAYKADSSTTVDIRTLPPDFLRAGSFDSLRVVSRELTIPKFNLNYEV